MANYIYIATSLDGYIATKDGGIEWLNEIPNPDGSDYGFSDFLSRIDALVMGRNTFETVVSFGEWPYPKPVFVLSHKLTAVPEHLQDKAEILSGNVNDIVTRLNKAGYQNLYIDGGNVIQNFLSEDLIDEMIITLIPILLGDGIPLFGRLSSSRKFELKETKRLGQYMVMNTFKRTR